MSLYQRVRPASFEDIVGNTDVVANLRTLVAQPSPPCAWLMMGPPGTGKTTLGRIIVSALGVHPDDYREVDSADFRGIDTVREIRHASNYVGLRGPRAWLIDECFARGTRVMTSVGEISIQDIRQGDCVYSLAGPSRVLNTFRNVVSIDRIVRLVLSNGRTVFTTVDHLFLSQRRQWKKAGMLRVGDLLLSFSCNTMLSMDCGVRHEDAIIKDVSRVRNSICYQEVGTNVLFSGLRPHASATIETSTDTCAFAGMSGMREGFLSQECQQRTAVLYTDLRQAVERSSPEGRTVNSPVRSLWETGKVLPEPEGQLRHMQQNLWQYPWRIIANWARRFGGYEAQDWGCQYSSTRPEHGIRITSTPIEFRTHVEGKSVLLARSDREGQGDEAYSWLPAYLEGGAGRKWEAYYLPGNACYGARVADGGRRADGAFAEGWQWVPDLLQVGYRERDSEAWNRGRWQGTSGQEQQGKGREEGAETGGVRVESIEVYQPGRRNENFRGVIGNRERSCGFAIFYDLEVEDDPSYYAEGVAVHNCAKLTNDAQHALLKGLEDPPPNVYFVLCTTDPEKLLEAIRSRCSIHKVSPLGEPDMVRLLHRVATGEGERLARPQLRAIWEKTEGKPRAAIQLLEKCLAAAPEARDALIGAAEAVREATASLAQGLMKGLGWKEVAGILSQVEEDDVESVRRGLLGYASKVLLGGENDRAGLILDQMVEPFFNSGKPGLIHAVYTIVRG